MRSDNRAVYQHVFHIRVAGKMPQHRFPNPIVTPAREPLVNTIPLPVLGGEQAPLCAAAIYPEHRFHEAATFPGGANLDSSLALQRLEIGVDFHPLSVIQSYSFHEAYYASFINTT